MRNQSCNRSFVEATKTIKWTGKIIDLVEVIYAICEDGSINGGTTKKRVTSIVTLFFMPICGGGVIRIAAKVKP